MIYRYLLPIMFCVLSICGIQAQDMEWLRLEGIKGSYITSIAQTHSGAVFVSTPYGIWRSIDTLQTWVKVSSGLRDSLIYSLAATGDGGILASGYKGVYKSMNNGEEWSTVTPNQTIQSYRYLYAHPKGTCFLGSRKRLFTSTNHGKTWSLFADSVLQKYYQGTINRQYGMAVLGNDNRMLLTGYYTNDNGKTFLPKNRFITATTQSLYSDNNGKIWLLSHGFASGYNAASPLAILFSESNGTEWENFADDIHIEPEQLPAYRNSMAQRNKEFFDIHSSGSSCLFLSNDTLLMSILGVGIWKVTVQLEGNAHGKAYVIKYKKDVTDNGFISHYPTCSYMLRDSTILIGSYGSGLFKSKDRGNTWSEVDVPDESPIITMFYNDKERNRLYAGTANGLYESKDNGIVWQRIDSGFIRPIITSLTVTKKGTVIVSSYNECYRRELGSNQWTIIRPLSDFDQTVTQLYCTGDSIFATKRDLWLSTDDGKTFIVFTPHEAGSFTWTGCNKVIAYHNKILLTIGTYSLNRFMNNGWEQKKDFFYRYDDPYVEIIDVPITVSTAVNSSYVSPYDNQVFLCLNYGITTYDWQNNIVPKNDKKGEWLFGEWCFGITADQKGRPFAATMNGIAYSPKAGKDWEFLPQPKDLSLPAMMSMGTDDKGYIYSSSLFGGVYRTKNPVIILQAPELVSPVHKAQEIAKNSQLKWKSVTDAKHYTLQVATDSLFTNIVLHDSLATAITYGLTLKENNTYYWRVRGRLFGIVSPWSETRTFSTIKVFPSTVQLREPVNGAQNRNTTLKVMWNPAVQSESYHLQIADNNTFNTPFINDSIITDTEKKIENLENGNDYFWRVRGKNKAGYGTWSDIWNFRTKEISSIAEGESQMRISIINNEIIIGNNPFSEEKTTIKITDITGQNVYIHTLPEGIHNNRIIIPPLTNGYYIITIESPSATHHKRIIYFQ